ncbi:MAG: hypothetical protein E7045_07505 [Lentisphaerae bacterium]|nr:hypothetical protein [Lentisphaerota bacterium]
MMMPIYPFAPNRVLRLYLGGYGIDQLCGKTPAEDTRFPENWIASVIEGNGRAYHSPGHGISKILIDGTPVDFPQFLRDHAEMMLGPAHAAKFGPVPGVLVKFLDSAEQLPLQMHPTRADAKKYLHSDYGKTEAWIVLSTRKINGREPYLLVGFNDKLDRGLFTWECLDGKFVKGETMLNKLYVSPGDVIIIRGGLPHAIGPGVTMVEIMEPSDWVIVPEINCCGVQLNEKQRFMGIDPEIAVNMTDFTPYTIAEIREKFFTVRKLLEKQGTSTLTSLISPAECGYFSASELKIDGQFRLAKQDSFAIGAVVEGNLNFGGTTVEQGGSFFLPYATKEVMVSGNGRVILIDPPRVS